VHAWSSLEWMPEQGCVVPTRARISRPQSSTIQTGWLRSVWYWRVIRPPCRGGCPADVAQVVAFAILTQAFEVSAQAALLGSGAIAGRSAAAGEKYLLLFAGAQSGVDAHRLG